MTYALLGPAVDTPLLSLDYVVMKFTAFAWCMWLDPSNYSEKYAPTLPILKLYHSSTFQWIMLANYIRYRPSHAALPSSE